MQVHWALQTWTNVHLDLEMSQLLLNPLIAVEDSQDRDSLLSVTQIQKRIIINIIICVYVCVQVLVSTVTNDPTESIRSRSYTSLSEGTYELNQFAEGDTRKEMTYFR